MLNAPGPVRSRRSSSGDIDLDDALADFTVLRPRLLGIAYRILASWTEAENTVQEAWLLCQTCDRSAGLNSTAFLVTTTTRLAMNTAQSARLRHESQVGQRLPEPVDTSDDPALGAERNEALELGILMLLQQLSPTERAAYVLRQAFDYPYSRIAEIVQLSETNARQLVRRASKHVAAQRRRSASRAEQQRLMLAFVAAAQRGDVRAVESLLAADVVILSDGGGTVRAARFPVEGRERVADSVATIARQFWSGHLLNWTEANGRTAAVLTTDGRVAAMVTVTASVHGIDRIIWLVNPAKLSGLAISPCRPLLGRATC